jgi:hypothetical protein
MHKDYFRNKNRATRNRKIINRFKRMKGCVDCGYKAHYDALEFDHIDETTKTRTVGSMMYSSLEAIKVEIRKCVVRCSNCHMIRTRHRNYRKNGR